MTLWDTDYCIGQIVVDEAATFIEYAHGARSPSAVILGVFDKPSTAPSLSLARGLLLPAGIFLSFLTSK